MDDEKNINDSLIEKNKENKNVSQVEKGPLNYLSGAITSLILSIIFYWISNKVAIYFAIHKPSNKSEIVQSISTSFNTLIVGLFFLATFSFVFVAAGLFIVFIRSFFEKKIKN